MANQWLRLWHDMPTDPKWKTIARVSGQPISLVQAVYLHLLVDASRNVTRGHATVTHEDLASALDVTEGEIKSVLDAMQGRVLAGDYLSGWDKRQVKREEGGSDESSAKSAAQRKREQRERDRESQPVTQCHDESRNVTLDKDKDKEEKNKAGKPSITLGTYLAAQKELGQQAIPDKHAVNKYAEEAGIPPEFLALAWGEFKAKYTTSPNDKKKQRDWPGVFLNAVKGNWMKVWFLDAGTYKLTTVGQQAELARSRRADAH